MNHLEKIIQFCVFTLPQVRLDRFLAACQGLFQATSRSQIQKWIEEGQIRVNGKPEKASYRLRIKDSVELHYRELSPVVVAEKIALDILYEDEDILAVNKSAGMVVHPAGGHLSGTLVNALLAHAPHFSSLGGVLRSGIVHRLDKETSGIILVAKNEEASRRLTEQFKERVIHKTYLALVYGSFPEKEGIISLPIGRHRADRKRMTVAERGKIATTRWRLLSLFPGVSLLEVMPQTGRTHQIRVHLAHLHHPIVGDALYGGTQQRAKSVSNARLRDLLLQMKRQALHALKLSFSHPMSGKLLELEAPLPEDFKNLLEQLREVGAH